MISKRLEDPGSEATELERRLIAARTDPKPRESDRALVWQRLMIGWTAVPTAELPSAPAGPPPAVDLDRSAPPPALAPALASSLPWAPLVLSGLFGLALGVVATASFFLLSDNQSPAVSTAPADPASTSPPAGSVSPVSTGPRGPTESLPSIDVDQLPPMSRDRPNYGQHERGGEGAHSEASRVAGAAAASAASDHAASQLRQEAALLRQAREQLGRGALPEASKTLAQSRTTFPASRLAQEREALTIELYVRQGRTLEASTLARVFLSKYPHSPHAPQVRRALEAGSQD